MFRGGRRAAIGATGARRALARTFAAAEFRGKWSANGRSFSSNGTRNRRFTHFYGHLRLVEQRLRASMLPRPLTDLPIRVDIARPYFPTAYEWPGGGTKFPLRFGPRPSPSSFHQSTVRASTGKPTHLPRLRARPSSAFGRCIGCPRRPYRRHGGGRFDEYVTGGICHLLLVICFCCPRGCGSARPQMLMMSNQ